MDSRLRGNDREIGTKMVKIGKFIFELKLFLLE